MTAIAPGLALPTATYRVTFRRRRPVATEPQEAPVGRVLRVARLLALAHKIDGLIRTGEIKDLADAARLAGLTRARVTQITNLLLLAPEIQEEILDPPRVERGRDPISERDLRPIAAEPVWERQIDVWSRRSNGHHVTPASASRALPSVPAYSPSSDRRSRPRRPSLPPP